MPLRFFLRKGWYTTAMTRIGIVGDTHGRSAVVIWILDNLNSQGIKEVHSVGDFGLWPGTIGSKFLAEVNTHLSHTGQTLYITLGNHEDYTQIRGLKTNDEGWLILRKNILVAPRGHRWTRDGRTFVSLGGAPSVDRAWRVRSQRTTGRPVWWKEEDITREDMDKTMEGGHAEIMVAHDAPLGVPTVEKNIEGNPMGFQEEDLEYALEGRKKMLEVVETIKPDLYLHGHYHFQVDDVLGPSRIVGLSADGEKNSFGILDLDDLSFEWR